MKKKSTSLRTKLIGIIVPIVILIIVSFFILARNMVLQISKDELLAQSQVSAEKITAWTQQIFGELKIYKDTIETGGFESDAEILAYIYGR